MNSLEEKISANIRYEIETSAKSKSQIAAELGVARATVSQYLSGKIQPSLATFARLCAVLDASADDILCVREICEESTIA